MALSDSEMAQPASSRYCILVMGGDAVFLHDRRLGQKVYMGSGKPLPRPELRRYISILNQDLRHLTVGDFFSKYGLRG